MPLMEPDVLPTVFCESGSILDCAICCERKELPEKTITARCKHVPNVCSSCISTYVKMEVVQKRQSEILCIESGCSEIVDYQEMKAVCDKLTSECYILSCLRNCCRKNKNLMFARLPTALISKKWRVKARS